VGATTVSWLCCSDTLADRRNRARPVYYRITTPFTKGRSQSARFEIGIKTLFFTRSSGSRLCCEMEPQPSTPREDIPIWGSCRE